MRFRRLFKKPQPADPFAVFAQTYGIRTPQDAPPPKPSPKNPNPLNWVPRALTSFLSCPSVHLGKK
jgi:hypothetical protein